MTKSKLEKIADIEEEIRQLKQRQKQLRQQHSAQERKARTKRLIERGAILESLIDGADTLTNEEIKTVLTAALGSGQPPEPLAANQGQRGAEQTAGTGTAQGARA